MRNVTEFQHHLRLISEEEINEPWPTMFIKTIERAGPDDIVHSVQVYDEVGETHAVSIRHFFDEENENNVYEVPLTRNLTEKEAEKIVLVWQQLFEDDFIIETSTPYTGKEPKDNDIMTVDNFKDFAEAVAKKTHSKWLHDRSNGGWRFGIEFNSVEKTHPMMRPWQELPEEYKNIDTSMPGFLTDLLDGYGIGMHLKKEDPNDV